MDTALNQRKTTWICRWHLRFDIFSSAVDYTVHDEYGSKLKRHKRKLFQTTYARGPTAVSNRVVREITTMRTTMPIFEGTKLSCLLIHILIEISINKRDIIH